MPLADDYSDSRSDGPAGAARPDGFWYRRPTVVYSLFTSTVGLIAGGLGAWLALTLAVDIPLQPFVAFALMGIGLLCLPVGFILGVWAAFRREGLLLALGSCVLSLACALPPLYWLGEALYAVANF